MPVMPKNAVELFGMLGSSITAQPHRAKGVGVCLAFVINGQGGGCWVFDPEAAVLHSFPLGKQEATDAGWLPKAKCVVEMGTTEMRALVSRPSDGMALYFSGKIKISGEPMAANKLQQLFSLLQ